MGSGQQSVCWDSSTSHTLWVPHNINRHPSTSVVCQRSTEDMSDEEYYEEEEEEEVEEEEEEEEYEEEETKTNPDERKSMRSAMSEGDGNFLKARQEAKEEEELKRLKEKQSKRKEIRAEQEKKLAQQKK